MFEDSPEFVHFLTDKYGTGQRFWEAYENDVERETREKMGAEGPDDIADRVKGYLQVLTRAMRSYHESHPKRKVIAWVESHYDTISPFLKRDVASLEKTDYLPVDHGAGIVINVGKDQGASTNIKGRRYDFSLSPREAQ